MDDIKKAINLWREMLRIQREDGASNSITAMKARAYENLKYQDDILDCPLCNEDCCRVDWGVEDECRACLEIGTTYYNLSTSNFNDIEMISRVQDVIDTIRGDALYTTQELEWIAHILSRPKFPYVEVVDGKTYVTNSWELLILNKGDTDACIPGDVFLEHYRNSTEPCLDCMDYNVTDHKETIKRYKKGRKKFELVDGRIVSRARISVNAKDLSNLPLGEYDFYQNKADDPYWTENDSFMYFTMPGEDWGD